MKIFQVDSFTKIPFSGNPAGVCVLQKPAKAQWMQNVAGEMNLAETAFLYPIEKGVTYSDLPKGIAEEREEVKYHLRWFTPTVEVDLCGHATLASYHILQEQGYIDLGQQVPFYTRSGWLLTSGNQKGITMDFPLIQMHQKEVDVHEMAAFGNDIVKMADSGKGHLIIQISDDNAVKSFQPDFEAFKPLGENMLILTAESSDPQYDFISRVFAPAFGIPEDPVTGSAHCALAEFWQSIIGKDHLSAYQASRRGGSLKLTINNDRVKILGEAVTVLEGVLKG